ncbi:hypothetical protein GWK47_027577 [Chionoecetes opilio]|uniref:Uncharacterized protein n=1 Tax=Chionoecetes opilio TaxID=41210 RepID=A0A8J8WMF2_CHIOP|nr:hypothetical protein GWK47_027577 [Chionoecetes opilio]
MIVVDEFHSFAADVLTAAHGQLRPSRREVSGTINSFWIPSPRHQDGQSLRDSSPPSPRQVFRPSVCIERHRRHIHGYISALISLAIFSRALTVAPHGAAEREWRRSPGQR